MLKPKQVVRALLAYADGKSLVASTIASLTDNTHTVNDLASALIELVEEGELTEWRSEVVETNEY